MDKTHGFCAALSKKDMTQGKIALVQTISEEGLPLYESLREAFLAHPEYEQVFSGLTHNQRDVLVLDFDEMYTELFRDEVFAKCDKLSDVYYNGSPAQFGEICGGTDFVGIENATIHYYASPAPELKITTVSGHPKIYWNAVDGAVKYWVYRSTDGKTFQVLRQHDQDQLHQ